MNGSSELRGVGLRRLGSILLPILFVLIGIAAVRGLGIPQNGFVGLLLLAVAAGIAITSLVRAGGGAA